MKLFKPLLDPTYLKSYIEIRINNPNPIRSRRYKKKYYIEDENNLLPKIENLIGFAKNRFKSLAKDYKHGKYQLFWTQKTPDDEYPRSTKKEPEYFKEEYREILSLNRVDLFIHSVIADRLRKTLLKHGYIKRMRSRQERIIDTIDFLNKAIKNNRLWYLKTDIQKFGETFDTKLARETIFKKLNIYTDSEDIDLLNNVYDSFREKIEQHSGSPIDQVLGEWILSLLDNHLQKHYGQLFNNNYYRYGEDMVFVSPSKKECQKIADDLKLIVKKILGADCKLHEVDQTLYYPKERCKWMVPLIDEKSVITQFNIHGLEFCGYYYSLNSKSDVVIGIRDQTMDKMAIRITECTEGRDIRYDQLPQDLKNDMKIKWMIIKLNKYFGYYRRKREESNWGFSIFLGIGHLFCLPKNIDDSLIKDQARRLNHFMLRRIRHLHLRNWPGNTEDIRNWRQQVDKGYRELGLRTVIDGINN